MPPLGAVGIPGLIAGRMACQAGEDVNVRQAAELAATLPDPLGANPATRSRYFRRRAAKILRLLQATARHAPIHHRRAAASSYRAAFAESAAHPL